MPPLDHAVTCRCLQYGDPIPTIATMTNTRRVANGEAIKALREALGWRARRFADAAGLSQPYLCHIERGNRKGSPEALLRIAETLGVPLAAVSSVETVPPRRVKQAA